MVSCECYSPSKKLVWDNFVEISKTPLFFFKRDYLEYHADRFYDFSLMFYKNEELIAIFPACKEENTLISHGGLTCGGLLISNKIRSTLTLEIMASLLTFAKNSDIKKILYKAIPYFLAQSPAQEDLYALTTVANASLYRRDLSSIICLNNPIKLSKGKNWLIARAKKNGLSVISSQDWEGFHLLLSDVLKRYQTIPVHSVSELKKLADLFPNNLQLKVIAWENKLIAATLLFKFKTAVHTQYLATSALGKSLGALDFLIHTCIQESKLEGFNYFSFGISTEEQGRLLNEGLVAQKENFGARGVVLDFYEININD